MSETIVTHCKWSAIFASDRNFCIGVDGHIPWHDTEDLQFFKRTTLGSTVVMGRKTWESLGCKPLPKRENVVLSRTLKGVPSGVYLVNDVKMLPYLCDVCIGKSVFVIGGSAVYEKLLDYCTKIYHTLYDFQVANPDVFFPEQKLRGFKVIDNVEVSEGKRRLIYERF